MCVCLSPRLPPPFPRSSLLCSLHALRLRVQNGVRPTVPYDCPEPLSQLIRECWNQRPACKLLAVCVCVWGRDTPNSCIHAYLQKETLAQALADCHPISHIVVSRAFVSTARPHFDKIVQTLLHISDIAAKQPRMHGESIAVVHTHRRRKGVCVTWRVCELTSRHTAPSVVAVDCC